MKTLGLIGGSSWASTVDYYRGINMGVNEKLGRFNSARLFMYSLNMDEFYDLINDKGWDVTGEFLADIAQKLEAAGAEALVICANTPHITAPLIAKHINIPIIHIVEATAKEIKRLGLKKVALLGTKVTMENGFYQAIMQNYGIDILVPNDEDREYINHTIFFELGKEIFKPETKKRYLDIINNLQQEGAQGVILGCTEIPLLLKQEDSPVPMFDTIEIHVKAAVDWMLNDK
jgi:aspartate racemase